ncbi:MAG: hypothetical protein AB9866_10190 [Syntrophobacteraceae bacterium]
MPTLPNTARHTVLMGIILVCALSTLISGCGRKMFPKPPGEGPPPQIADLKAQVVSRSVELSWTLPAAGLPGGLRYSIMRSELKWENRNCLECPAPDQVEIHGIDSASASAIATAANGKLLWTDTNIVPHRAYRYQVVLQDRAANPLTLSNAAIAKVYPAPAAPLNLAAATQPQGILLNWKGVPKDTEGQKLQGELVFRIERLAADKGWEKASPASIKGNSYLDQTIGSDLNYSYRVIPALVVDNTTILGEPSAVVLARSPESVPPPPPAKVWIVPAKGALEIRWTESDGKNAGYHVYRREGKEIIRLTASPVNHPPFMDKGAKKSVTYHYAVSAVSSQADHKEGLLSKWSEMRNLLME